MGKTKYPFLHICYLLEKSILNISIYWLFLDPSNEAWFTWVRILLRSLLVQVSYNIMVLKWIKSIRLECSILQTQETGTQFWKQKHTVPLRTKLRWWPLIHLHSCPVKFQVCKIFTNTQTAISYICLDLPWNFGLCTSSQPNFPCYHSRNDTLIPAYVSGLLWESNNPKCWQPHSGWWETLAIIATQGFPASSPKGTPLFLEKHYFSHVPL